MVIKLCQKQSFPAAKLTPLVRKRLRELTLTPNQRNVGKGGHSKKKEPTLSPIMILANACQCSTKTIGRWRDGTTGYVGLVAADKAAIGLGFHIGDIWPEYYDE